MERLDYTNLLFISFCLLLFWSGFGQQESQFTQYMYNTQVFNPAYAGNRGVMGISAVHRAQWVGVPGAPLTNTVTLNTPMGDNGVGLGASFLMDAIGPSKEYNLAFDFSYSIQISQLSKLSLGLKGGINVLNLDYSRLNIYDPSDLEFDNEINHRIAPIVGLGFYWHKSDKWYLGFSSPSILKTRFYDDIQSSEVSRELHLYFMGGYVFDLRPHLKFKPAFLLKSVTGAPMGVDVSANFMIQNRMTIGASYRLDAAFSALAAFQVNDQIMIGYSYDRDITGLGNYNLGSHEIFLRFELINNVKGKVNPRFF